MYLAVKAVCDANQSTWATLQAFSDGYTDFTTQITTIQSLAQAQLLDTSGLTQDKNAAQLTMCQAAVGIASAVRAYAIKTKNNALAEEVDFSLSDLTGARDAASAENCQNIHDVANTSLASLASYGVTAAKLTALQTAITAFNTALGKVKQTSAGGKTATDQLAAAFDAADTDLAEELDNLIKQFAASAPKFVSDYTNARNIVDTSASHASPTPPTPPPAPPHP